MIVTYFLKNFVGNFEKILEVVWKINKKILEYIRRILDFSEIILINFDDFVRNSLEDFGKFVGNSKK